ncbi:unnamed protein product, partial [Symbiodinium sp. CCMP2456]
MKGTSFDIQSYRMQDLAAIQTSRFVVVIFAHFIFDFGGRNLYALVQSAPYARAPSAAHTASYREATDGFNGNIPSQRGEKTDCKLCWPCCTRWRELARGRHAKRREKLREEMEGILDLVMHMAFADMEQEQLTDKEEVDPTLWREWVSLFQENLPVRLVPSLEDCAEEPAPLTSLPEPTGLANLHPPGSTLNAAALRDFVQGVGQWEVPKTVLDEAQPAVIPFDHEVEVKAALEEVQEAGLVLH